MRRASRKDYKKRDATALFALGASAALVNTASATFTYIAGYEPTSSVENHNKVDLDLYDIMKNADLPANNAQVGFPCTGEECNWVSGLLKPADWITDSEQSLCNNGKPPTGYSNSRYVSGATLVVDTDVAKCNTSYGIWRFGHNSHKSNEVRSFWLFADGLSGSGEKIRQCTPGWFTRKFVHR